MAWIRTALIALLVLGSTAGAEIVIEDPAGDVELDGLPAGAAGAAYDLRQVTLHQHEDHLRLRITLDAVPSPHDSAEFVVVFQGNGTWMAGYTALPYTDPAPRYQGGFACPATMDGFVNGSQSGDCIGLPDWSLEGTTYTVDVPLAFIEAGEGTVIFDAWGYAELSPYLKGDARVDTTDRGGMFVIELGAAGPDADLPGPDERTPMLVGVVLWGMAWAVRRRR